MANPAQTDAKTKPITESDAAIARAIADAHLPSLIAAAAHLSGDAAILRMGATPVYDFFGDGQGGFTPEQTGKIPRADSGGAQGLSRSRLHAWHGAG